MTDTIIIALLLARADVAEKAGQLELVSRLKSAARSIETHNRNAELRTIVSQHNADDYDSWMQCGARLKATGYDQAFYAWKSFSKTSPKYDWENLNKAWVSFPKPPEPQA